MANNSKRNSNRAGAVLITVLTVACFAAILLTAVLTFVKRAHTNAFNNYNSEQAYYIASSALGSVHDYFEQEKTQNYPTLVSYAEAGTEGTITLGNDAISSLIPGGDCKVNISKVNEGYIRLSVTGYYNGQAETINAYYAVTPGQKASGIDNALYSNGAANFNQQCSNTGSVTTGGDYNTTNGSTSSGSVICGKDLNVLTGYHWKNDANGAANSYIVVGHNFNTNNGSFVVEPRFAKTEDNVTQFLSIGGRFWTSLETHIGLADKEFDVYCSTAKVTSTNVFEMYGNLYVYKLDDFDKVHGSCGCGITADDMGDLELANQSTLEIYGDVFVEGDVILSAVGNSRNIHGTLYVSPTTEFKGTKPSLDQQKLTVDAISGDGLTTEKVRQWINAGYLRINGVSGTTDADLAGKVLTDPINHGSASSRNHKPEVDFDPNYIKTYETTQEFLDNPDNATIKTKYQKALNTNLKDYKNEFTDSELGIKFDYKVDGRLASDGGNGCMIDEATLEGDGNKFANGGKRVLVDMNQFTGDYVIRVKGVPMHVYEWDPVYGNVDYDVNQMSMPTIIVKNGIRNDDGSWSSTKSEGCLYIIADETSPNMRYRFFKTGIMDYYTYKFLMKNDYGLNIGGYGKDGNGVVELNATSGYAAPNGSDHGVYTPDRTRIFLMLKPGDSMTAGETQDRANGNDPLIEAVVYAPQASCNISTYGCNDLLFLRDPGTNQLSYLSVDQTYARLTILGAIICETFTGDEQFGVGFIPPSTDTNLGGGGAGQSVGSVKFSHYESR